MANAKAVEKCMLKVCLEAWSWSSRLQRRDLLRSMDVESSLANAVVKRTLDEGGSARYIEVSLGRKRFRVALRTQSKGIYVTILITIEKWLGVSFLVGYVTDLQRMINNLLLLCTSYTTLWVECEVHHLHIPSNNSAKVKYPIATLPRSVTFTLNSVLGLHRLQRNTEFSCNVSFQGVLPDFSNLQQRWGRRRLHFGKSPRIYHNFHTQIFWTRRMKTLVIQYGPNFAEQKV